MNKVEGLEGREINDGLVLGRVLGRGSFAHAYYGRYKTTGEEVAVKVQLQTTNLTSLGLEYERMLDLARALPNPAALGIPVAKSFFVKDSLNFLVMELLGHSLETYFQHFHQRLSLKTVLMIGMQMIETLEYIHSRGYIHRDMKPDNFLVGRGKNSGRIFLIDYGVAAKFVDSKGNHIPLVGGKSLVGTVRYSSLNTHYGHDLLIRSADQSRRDDLEGLGYVLVYFATGGLPWQGMKGDTKQQRNDAIRRVKESTPLSKLCVNLPPQMLEYMTYVRKLQFAETPDYKYLRGLFQTAYRNLNYPEDGLFDWDSPSPTPLVRLSTPTSPAPAPPTAAANGTRKARKKAQNVRMSRQAPGEVVFVEYTPGAKAQTASSSPALSVQLQRSPTTSAPSSNPLPTPSPMPSPPAIPGLPTILPKPVSTPAPSLSSSPSPVRIAAMPTASPPAPPASATAGPLMRLPQPPVSVSPTVTQVRLSAAPASSSSQFSYVSGAVTTVIPPLASKPLPSATVPLPNSVLQQEERSRSGACLPPVSANVNSSVSSALAGVRVEFTEEMAAERSSAKTNTPAAFTANTSAPPASPSTTLAAANPTPPTPTNASPAPLVPSPVPPRTQTTASPTSTPAKCSSTPSVSPATFPLSSPLPSVPKPSAAVTSTSAPNAVPSTPTTTTPAPSSVAPRTPNPTPATTTAPTPVSADAPAASRRRRAVASRSPSLKKQDKKPEEPDQQRTPPPPANAAKSASDRGRSRSTRSSRPRRSPSRSSLASTVTADRPEEPEPTHMCTCGRLFRTAHELTGHKGVCPIVCAGKALLCLCGARFLSPLKMHYHRISCPSYDDHPLPPEPRPVRIPKPKTRGVSLSPSPVRKRKAEEKAASSKKRRVDKAPPQPQQSRTMAVASKKRKAAESSSPQPASMKAKENGKMQKDGKEKQTKKEPKTKQPQPACRKSKRSTKGRRSRGAFADEFEWGK